jgi:hypothetical protein
VQTPVVDLSAPNGDDVGKKHQHKPQREGTMRTIMGSAEGSWLQTRMEYAPYSSMTPIPPAPHQETLEAAPTSIHDIPTLIPPPDYDDHN